MAARVGLRGRPGEPYDIPADGFSVCDARRNSIGLVRATFDRGFPDRVVYPYDWENGWDRVSPVRRIVWNRGSRECPALRGVAGSTRRRPPTGVEEDDALFIG